MSMFGSWQLVATFNEREEKNKEREGKKEREGSSCFLSAGR